MKNVILELSKYVVLIFMTIYTLIGFQVFSKKKGREERIFRTQRILIFLLQFLLNLVLYLVTQNTKIIILYLCQLAFVVTAFCLFPFVYHNISRLILNHMTMLLSISFIMLERLSYDVAKKQLIVASIGLLISLIVPMLIEKMRILSKLWLIYGSLGLAILLYVIIYGKEIYGAKNWVNLFGIMIQPSEFVKLLFVFFVGSALVKRNNFMHVILISVLAAGYVVLLVAERDLGAALIFSVTYMFMLYVATSQSLYLFGGVGAASIASVCAYRYFSHVRVRVNAWKNPWADISGDGYQVTQSLFAIGTGGWFGLGLGRGLPTNIPVVKSDFIFSAISEELGAIFAFCIILIYLNCFIMFINVTLNQREMFYKLVALGLGVIFIFQVFLCIGGATKFIPSTGVTLPLISNGGSSVLYVMILFSIFQGIYVMNQVEDEKIERKKKKSKGNTRPRKKQAESETSIS